MTFLKSSQEFPKSSWNESDRVCNPNAKVQIWPLQKSLAKVIRRDTCDFGSGKMSSNPDEFQIEFSAICFCSKLESLQVRFNLYQ